MPVTPQQLDINLGTVKNVEKVLQEAGVPVTRYFIMKTLAETGQATTAPRLEIALEYLVARELAAEGEKGIQWVHSGSESLRRAIAIGRRV